MSFLKRESGVDILDLTLLQRKGLLKLPAEMHRGADILDLTAPHPAPPSLPSPPSPAPGPVTPLPSFFDAQAFGASSTPIADNPFAMMDTLAATPATTMSTLGTGSVDPMAFNAFKLKLDDLEFKFERLMEKFALLNGFEK